MVLNSIDHAVENRVLKAIDNGLNCGLLSLEHSLNCSHYANRSLSENSARYDVTLYALKQLKYRSCGLFSYRARYDTISFSNCKKELSFASFFCTTVWKFIDVLPCSKTEQCTPFYVLTVYRTIRNILTHSRRYQRHSASLCVTKLFFRVSKYFSVSKTQ